MSTLSLKNINKIYANNVQAVFDFNLEIKDKEFVVLVGPSGCGKSTTLRMIAGLEDITFGELYIDGQLMNNVEPKDRHIAMVFQNYALYPHMTVYQNMAFALKLRKRAMPIYEENKEIDALNLEINNLYKEINKIDRKYKKDQNNSKLLEEHISLYHKVYEILDKITAIRKPVFGINESKINELTKTCLKFEKEINNENKILLSKKNFAEGEKSAIEESIKQKEKLINKIKEDIEYYKNNEVALTEYRHLTKREIDIEINKTSESIDLVRYLFRKPSALSGGQRQRVALGRAIVRKPKVFLMDEPLSNLDAKLRVQTRSEITKIHNRVGATTVYVTHDQTEAMTMADRIVIMKDGYIQQIGTPKEVYNDPDNMFVGGFIGSPSMNFIRGVINKDKFTIKSSSNDEKSVVIVLSKENAKLLGNYQDKEVVLGVRPENLHVKGDVNASNPTNSIDLVCDFVELLGQDFMIHSYINGQKVVLKAPVEFEIKAEDKIKVCMNKDKIYFFDSETGKRIR